MKKRLAVMALALMMTVLSVAALCGCGSSSIEGTWYPVSEDPETEMGYLQFDSNSGVISDGIEIGKWQKDGDRYIIKGFVTEVYTIEDYEGYTVLKQEGDEYSMWCKDAEDAKTIYDMEKESQD